MRNGVVDWDEQLKRNKERQHILLRNARSQERKRSGPWMMSK